MTDFALESNHLPTRFWIDIEMRKPLEIDLGRRFLAELNELRGVPSSRLAEVFAPRCEAVQQEAAAA